MSISLDKMGLDEMGLDEMGLDEMGITPPRVLLISVPARMWVEFEGGNKMREGSILFTSLEG